MSENWQAIVRPPGRALGRLEPVFGEPLAIDEERAREQHARFSAALVACGVAVHELPPLDGAPEACFVADALCLLQRGSTLLALSSRSPLQQRNEEFAAVRALFAALAPQATVLDGAEVEVDFGGYWEGGDFLALDDRVHLGWSSRSSDQGLRRVGMFVQRTRTPQYRLAVRRAPHLRAVVGAIDGRTLLVDPPHVDMTRMHEWPHLVVDPSESWAANVLRAGDSVFVDTATPLTAARIAAAGAHVVPVDLGEFRKLEAGPSDLALVWSSP